VNWTAVITYRRWEEHETITGALGAIAYHLRQHAEEISHVDLTPVIEPLESDSYMSLDGDLTDDEITQAVTEQQAIDAEQRCLRCAGHPDPEEPCVCDRNCGDERCRAEKT
jgi:hypothetical protein